MPKGSIIDQLMNRDERPPLKHLGWAPGHYSNQCRICKEHFIGDKRASCCGDCAYEIEGKPAE